MLDSQVQKVLDYIEANHDVSPARLCEEFGVSDRTIRTYVKKLNAVLEPQAHIHKHRGGGYTLNISDCDAYRSIKDDASNGGLKSIPSTSEGRVEYLLNDLLSRVDWIPWTIFRRSSMYPAMLFQAISSGLRHSWPSSISSLNGVLITGFA